MALLNKKNMVLAMCGATAFAIAYWLSEPADTAMAVVQPVIQSDKVVRTSRSTPFPLMSEHFIGTPERNAISSANNQDVFVQHSWLPPPPPAPIAAPPAPAAPVKPVAPPLPFSFVGMLEEKGAARRAFLGKGDQLIIVKSQDVVEGRYRVDHVSEKSVDLTYLPLNQKQSISIQQAGL